MSSEHSGCVSGHPKRGNLAVGLSVSKSTRNFDIDVLPVAVETVSGGCNRRIAGLSQTLNQRSFWLSVCAVSVVSTKVSHVWTSRLQEAE